MSPRRRSPTDPARDSAIRWLDEPTGREWLASGTDAFRIAESHALRFERFGAAGLISSQGQGLPSGFLHAVLEHPLTQGIEAIYHQTLVRTPREEAAPSLVWGASSGPRFQAREAGLTYGVDFSGSTSCGLFLDQRGNRAHLRQMRPRHLLNCFAYTCSFSVAAAYVGSATTSIDLSKRSLERGRENFATNGIADSGHRFFADDVFRLLPRLARRGERYDALVLDPPTFSRSKTGRVFQAESDLARLVTLALDCAAPGARFLLSTNCTRIDSHALRRIILDRCPQATAITPQPPNPDIRLGASSLWFTAP